LGSISSVHLKLDCIVISLRQKPSQAMAAVDVMCEERIVSRVTSFYLAIVMDWTNVWFTWMSKSKSNMHSISIV